MRARILVVDDSSTIRKVVCSILERHGFEPVPAMDGAAALEVLAAKDAGGAPKKFDMVLLDFVMPRMNGFQLCRAIRAREDTKSMPVLLMSAKSDKIREQFVQQTGAVDAITKPFDAEALVACVENALKRVEQGWQQTPSGPMLEESEIPPVSTRANRDESNMRARAAVEFGAKLVNLVAPAVASLPPESLADESKVIQALAERLGPDQLGELAGVVRETDLDDKTLALAGRLGGVPMGAILQLLQIEGMTGVLAIYGPSSDVTITMRAGLVDLVQGRGAGDEFRLGRFFVEDGLVTPEDIDALVTPSSATSGSTGKLVGELLVEAGKITEEQLRAALVRQSCELIYEVLRWQRGRFEFRTRGASTLALRARLGMPVASVVMEGFRRVDEWRLMEEKLGSFDQVLQPDPMSIEAMGEDKLPRAERAVLGAIDGRRTVREIIVASHLSSFDACRILFQLIEARLVRRKAA